MGEWAGVGADSNRRVVRGGSFNNNQRNVRAAIRNNNDPDNRNNNIGFRVVVSSNSVGLRKAVLRRVTPRPCERAAALKAVQPRSG